MYQSKELIDILSERCKNVTIKDFKSYDNGIKEMLVWISFEGVDDQGYPQNPVMDLRLQYEEEGEYIFAEVDRYYNDKEWNGDCEDSWYNLLEEFDFYMGIVDDPGKLTETLEEHFGVD